jgi:hypothetical protein
MHDNKLLIEKYSAGDTDAHESRCIGEHCKTCRECADYLDVLKNDRRQFLAVHSFARFKQNCEPVRRRPWYEILGNALSRPSLIPAYGCLAVILLLVPMIYLKGMKHAAPADEITFKGGNALSFLLKHNGSVSVCAPFDTVHAGDEIQVLYSMSRNGYISLLSVDSCGTISWYQDPQSPQYSLPVKPGHGKPFPAGIQFDDSKGGELVIALFSDAALSRYAVQQWIKGSVGKTSADLSVLQAKLDSTGADAVNAEPVMALFRKGN